MRKNIKRLVAVLVVMAMIISMCSTAFAAGHGSKKSSRGSYKSYSKEVTDQATDPVVEESADTAATEDQAVDETAEITHPELSDTKSAGDIDVSVNAPEGALPSGTSLDVSEVEANEVEDAAAEVIDGEITDIAAVDISFVNDEGEVEPAEGTEVEVTISASALKEGSKPSVVHIKNDGSVEVIDADIDQDAGKATFKSGTFSTYALVWGSDQSATIHFGTASGDTFTEFDQTTISFDTTASTINIANTFSGYTYLGAVYCPSGISYAAGNDIDPILYKTETGWAGDVTTYDDEDVPTVTRTPIANGSDIYVVYYVPSEPVPSAPDDGTVPSPTTTKQVIHNADGTYTIQLDVEGATVTEDNSHYVNILVILDGTQSMSGTKWTNAKTAMRALVETLCEGENAANAGKIDFALVKFGRTATIEQNWTKNNVAFKATCAAQNMVNTTGTNWEAGLRGGLYGVLNNMPDTDPTYVIFLTDGDPNRQCSDGDTGTSYTGNTTSASEANAATRSQNEAYAIAHKPTKLYGIFCGTSTSTTNASYVRLNNVITGQGGEKTIAATADTIESEFQAIAETALKDIGANNVAVDDGVPSLSSVSATTAGEASGFEYYIGTKEEGATEPTYTTWADAPGASYSQDNGVTWDLSKVGTVSEGSYYRLKFKVWPSQEAYDMIADLNNGLITKTEEELDALGIHQNPETGIYELLTNTHLNTRYTVGNTEYSDSPSETPTDEMILPTTKINVVKYWNNDLDDRTAIENAKINVTKDGNFYEEVNLGTFEQVPGYAHKWIQRPDKDIYISMGQLTMDTTTNEIEVISSGHEYSVEEPESYSHNWWLTADIYHPMLVNGTPTVLVEVPEDEIPSSLSGLANNMHATDGGKDYYKFDNKLYVAQDAEDNILEATNDRRSHLNFTKEVTGEGAPADAYFTYNVTVTDSQNQDVWFSIFDAAEGGNVVKDSSLVTGATAEAGDTGYWHFESGKTATIKIKAGWNVRFINLPVDSDYEIVEVESSMEPGWVFDKAESSIVSDYDATPATISGSTATGKIDQANTKYVVTYTNKYLGNFYVYHSSDNTVERFPMAENGVKVTDFNIFERTVAGTLYGGYYRDYAGKSAGFDAAALTYTEGKSKDAGGTAYSYVYIKESNRAAWNNTDENKKAYTESGKAMDPEANKVYYLKEVPAAYILPYTHYTYNKSDKVLRNMWYISAIDDLNYEKAGFFVETVNADGEEEAIVVDTLTVTNNSGGAMVTLSPNSVFGNKGGTGKGVQAGYLGYWDASSKIAANETSKFTPFWQTPDQIYVCGMQNRTVNFNNGKVGSGGMRITDTANDTLYPTFE